MWPDCVLIAVISSIRLINGHCLFPLPAAAGETLPVLPLTVFFFFYQFFLLRLLRFLPPSFSTRTPQLWTLCFQPITRSLDKINCKSLSYSSSPSVRLPCFFLLISFSCFSSARLWLKWHLPFSSRLFLPSKKCSDNSCEIRSISSCPTTSPDCCGLDTHTTNRSPSNYTPKLYIFFLAHHHQQSIQLNCSGLDRQREAVD